MNDFINALRDDLLDRRLLPLVALAAAAVIGALAYTVLDGPGEGSSTAALAHPAPVGLRSGVSITPATRERALAETTSGGVEQRQGSSRNPFSLLPGALTSTSAASPAGAPSSGSSGSSAVKSPSNSSGGSSAPSGSSQGQGSGGSTPTPTKPSKPSKPSKPKTVYMVDVLFGEVPTGSTVQDANLTPHENLKLLTALPSIKEPLVVFRGVKSDGKSATFTVAGEAILSGNGVCAPSPEQCETISLSAGQSEQLQYLPAGAQAVLSYELRIVSIAAAEASAATVASLWRGRSVEGLEILRAENLLALPGLRDSSVAGVLLPAL